METKILMFCKKTLFCEYAAKILNSYYSKDEVVIVKGEGNSKIDEELYWYKPRYIISFLSPWIVPASLLNVAQNAAINFHPGSPRYPGSGCYNFALYEGAKLYGVTCHHMNPKVDTGDIIVTSYFDISPRETVETLKLKSMNHLLFIFEKVINQIYNNDSLTLSGEKWECSPYTKKQLDDLCKINPLTMDNDEIRRRIYANDYSPEYSGAYIEIDGLRFNNQSSIDKPIV